MRALPVLKARGSMAENPKVATIMSSREWILVLLLVLSVVINYIDRSNLALAVPLIQRQFALSPLQIGSLLSAFFWTYALLQRSEEHTSELQSLRHLVCRLLLEKKK